MPSILDYAPLYAIFDVLVKMTISKSSCQKKTFIRSNNCPNLICQLPIVNDPKRKKYENFDLENRNDNIMEVYFQ